MKKSHLFTTLCLLVLTIASLTFGVYSAIKTSFSASGTITFNAYDVECLLDVKITGIQADSDTTTDSTTHLSSKALKLSTFSKTGVTTGYTTISTSASMGNLIFDELNSNLTAEQRKTITITISLKNYSKYAVQLTGKVGSSIPTNLAVTLSSPISAEISNGTTAVAASQDYTITLKASGEIQKQTVSFANLTIEPYNEETFYQQYIDQGYEIAKSSNFTISNGTMSSYTGSATKVVIPKFANCIVIGAKTFAGAEIKEVVIADGYTEIGDSAFENSDSLVSVSIPNSVKTIGNNAFLDCQYLTSIVIPNSVTEIKQGAFSGTGLTSITIPSGLKILATDVFNNSQLTSVVIPNSVTTIDGAAFQNCSNLSSVTIPNSVITIGSSAFENCENLTSVTIPESVTTIYDSAFAGCTNLTTIDCKSSKLDDSTSEIEIDGDSWTFDDASSGETSSVTQWQQGAGVYTR